jgi:hypothetical protein
MFRHIVFVNNTSTLKNTEGSCSKLHDIIINEGVVILILIQYVIDINILYKRQVFKPF